MGGWKFFTYFILTILILQVLLLIPSESHPSMNVTPDNNREFLVSVNITETGLPKGSDWGYSMNDSSQWGGNFTTYDYVFGIPEGEYWFYSVYLLNSTGPMFKQFVGKYYLGATYNWVNITFYPVKVNMTGIPDGTPVHLGDSSYPYETHQHNFTLYMPNGTYSQYVGVRNYFSPDKLNFIVNGSPTSDNLTFVPCYNTTFNIKFTNGGVLDPYDSSSITGRLSILNVNTSYLSGYFNNTSFSFMVPNGTYNAVVFPLQPFSIYITTSTGEYNVLVTLTTPHNFTLNVSGKPQNVTLLFSLTFTPANTIAKLFSYRAYFILIPSIIIISVVALSFMRKKKLQ